MSQIWEETGEQILYCALEMLVFVCMKSAVNSLSHHHIKCPCHPLPASRKEKARSEEADVITCTWYDIHEALRLSSKPCTIFFNKRSDILCPKIRSEFASLSRKRLNLTGTKWEAMCV